MDFTAFHFLRPLMAGARDRGWDVEFACADGPDAALLRREGFGYRWVPMTRHAAPLGLAQASAVLAASLLRDRPDIIHTHTPAGGLVGRIAALAVPEIPVVHTLHGLPFPSRPTGLTERAFLALERALARRTAFTFSQARADAQRAEKLGLVRPGRIEVIGNGVDVRAFAPSPETREATRHLLGIAPDQIVVITIARLVREKGILDLADAADLVGRDDIVYLVVGRSLRSDRTAIDSELAVHPVRQRLGDRWRLLGHRDDVPDLLRAADIFVLPTWREGLPRSVIEAMAAGLPVIASDIPACRELVEPGVTGLLSPTRDPVALAGAISELAAASDRRTAMGSEARERAVQWHDERRIIERQIDLLDRIAREPR